MIGLAVVGIICLILLASYVGYSNEIEALESRGAWSVVFSGNVLLLAGKTVPFITEFKATYDSTPEIPGFMDYLTDRFSLSGGSPGQSVADNETFVILKLSVTVSGDDYDTTLLNEEVKLAYVWAGGIWDSTGKIGEFSYSLGPYVAYHEFSPYKITASVFAGDSKMIMTEYLTIPQPAEVTDG